MPKQELPRKELQLLVDTKESTPTRKIGRPSSPANETKRPQRSSTSTTEATPHEEKNQPNRQGATKTETKGQASANERKSQRRHGCMGVRKIRLRHHYLSSTHTLPSFAGHRNPPLHREPTPDRTERQNYRRKNSRGQTFIHPPNTLKKHSTRESRGGNWVMPCQRCTGKNITTTYPTTSRVSRQTRRWERGSRGGRHGQPNKSVSSRKPTAFQPPVAARAASNRLHGGDR